MSNKGWNKMSRENTTILWCIENGRNCLSWWSGLTRMEKEVQRQQFLSGNTEDQRYCWRHKLLLHTDNYVYIAIFHPAVLDIKNFEESVQIQIWYIVVSFFDCVVTALQLFDTLRQCLVVALLPGYQYIGIGHRRKMNWDLYLTFSFLYVCWSSDHINLIISLNSLWFTRTGEYPVCNSIK